MSRKNESCFICNESCRIWTSHVTSEGVTSRVQWVTSYVNESCHTWTSHVSYAMSHVACERVMSHVNESFFMCISRVCDRTHSDSSPRGRDMTTCPGDESWVLVPISEGMWHVSFAKEPYKRDHILHKRPIILRSLLIVATPYVYTSYILYGVATHHLIYVSLNGIIWYVACH